MRYRALSATGDYTFGQGQANFLVNTPAAVAQYVQTRLLLWAGEWFLDKTEGTRWSTNVLGKNTKALYDLEIQARVLQTPDVQKIDNYASSLSGRSLTISMGLETTFGPTTLQVFL